MRKRRKFLVYSPGVVWQAILRGLTKLIRHHPTDRFSTRVPIHGTFDEPEPAILRTVLNVFRNAFIKAFEGRLEKKGLPEVEPHPR